jgi:hypothetical protein
MIQVIRRSDRRQASDLRIIREEYHVGGLRMLKVDGDRRTESLAMMPAASVSAVMFANEGKSISRC